MPALTTGMVGFGAWRFACNPPGLRGVKGIETVNREEAPMLRTRSSFIALLSLLVVTAPAAWAADALERTFSGCS